MSAQQNTAEVCPSNVVSTCPNRGDVSSTSHRYTSWSSDADVRYRPSDVHAQSLMPFLCPRKVAMHAPSLTRHTFRNVLEDADANR